MLPTIGKFALAFLASALLALPLRAQEAIPLAAGEPYVHPHSGIGVPAVLGTISVRRGTAFAPDSLDVGVSFDTPGLADSLSVYVFRNTNGAVSTWFAQAQSAIGAREQFSDLALIHGPAAFTPPEQPHASGLRAVYEVRSSSYRSTGVALFEVNGWYVKLRASSKTRDAKQLHLWMNEALDALILPQGNAPQAVPIADCEAKLRFRGRAKDAKSEDNLGSILGGLLMGLPLDVTDNAEGTAAPPVTWCRDEQLGIARATYRANASANSYLLALGDNGNGVHVGPDSLAGILAGESAEDDKEPSAFAISLSTAGRNVSYAAQDRMPSPARVLELIEDNRVVGSAATWGDERNIEIDSSAF